MSHTLVHATSAGQVRGVWLTTTANDHIATPRHSAETMRRLRRIGLNTVYVETWKNGYTQFPSQVLKATVGVDSRPAGQAQDPGDPAAATQRRGRDLLQETLVAAHRQGLHYIAWFEYGFMAAYKDTDNHLRRLKPHWLTCTREGETVSGQNPFVWMNPLHPEVQRFLLDIILEAVERYDLDGVQLDDRIAWPVEMGYDAYTRRIYAEEHDGAQPPEDPRDPEWVAWRAEQVGRFASRLYAELKRRRPRLLVSISPAVFPWSLENYACDWPAWAAADLMDEYVPQVYRADFAAFRDAWAAQLAAVPEAWRVRLLAGIAITGADRVLPWEALRRKIAASARGGGHVHWYSRGVLDLYADELAALYAEAGPAHHPQLGPGWRPAPLVGRRTEGGRWRVRVEEPGRYRLVTRRDGVWRLTGTGTYAVGPAEIEAPAAEAVELLVDRRPVAP